MYFTGLMVLTEKIKRLFSQMFLIRLRGDFGVVVAGMVAPL